MEIRQKKFKFTLSKKWFNNSPFLTYIANANSIIIELAEELFTSLLKSSINKINDPELIEEVKLLLGQESWHKFNHKEFNAEIGKFYNLEDIIMELRASVLTSSVKIKKFENRVLISSSFERIAGRTSTSIICKLLKKTDPGVKEFWEWHKLEELEHKPTVIKYNKYFNNSYLKEKIFDFFFLVWYVKYLFKISYVQFKQDRQNATI
jgi:predicted metal-dependent hydrolase